MTKEEILLLQAKPRFIEYLKTTGAPFWPPALTICPYCGEQVGINILHEWHCTICCKKGDIVDYVLAVEHFEKRSDAMRHICQVLKIKGAEFETISAQELMDKQFLDQDAIVERLLHPGVYLLAGAHKVGKSWLALQLAHSVSTGEIFLTFPTNQASVLYFCLEDVEKRIQERLCQISQGETGDINFCTDVSFIGNGFEESLISYLTQKPSTKLVIIDTLQKIRSVDFGKYGYAKDYDTISRIKTIANHFGITILLIHHTRKMEDDDPFNMISGTTGLTGAVDGSMVFLKPDRTQTDAVLHTTGRDIEDMTLHLVFDKQLKLWRFKEFAQDVTEEKENPIIDSIVTFIRMSTEFHGTATDLINILETQEIQVKSPSALTRMLNSKTGYLLKKHSIMYWTERTSKERIIHITLHHSSEFESDDNDNSDDIISCKTKRHYGIDPAQGDHTNCGGVRNG